MEVDKGQGILPGFESYYRLTYTDANPKEKVKIVPDVVAKHITPFSNILSRISLFTSINRAKPRKYLNQEKLYSPEGIVAIYTGEQLNSADQDVLLAVIQQLKGKDTSNIATLSFPRWIQATGRSSQSMPNYRWFEQTVQRLTDTKLYISGRRFKAQFPLLTGYVYNPESQDVSIEMPSFALAMFHQGHNYIDMTRRRRLKNDMAKCLQPFICSHEKDKEQFTKTDYLQLFLDNKSRACDFRKTLRAAFNELITCYEVRTATIETNLTRWKRTTVGESPLYVFSERTERAYGLRG